MMKRPARETPHATPANNELFKPIYRRHLLSMLSEVAQEEGPNLRVDSIVSMLKFLNLKGYTAHLVADHLRGDGKQAQVEVTFEIELTQGGADEHWIVPLTFISSDQRDLVLWGLPR